MPGAQEIIQDNEEIMNGIIQHYNMLGIQNREAKNYDEAVKNYSKAISISPADENLFYNTARAYFEQGKLNKAEAFLGNALKLNPEFREAKEFFEYLQKVDQARAANSDNSVEKKSGWSFPKLILIKNAVAETIGSILKNAPGRRKANDREKGQKSLCCQ